MWTGIWALSTTSLSTSYAPRFTWLAAGLSPLVTYFLLRKVSGVPPLEVSTRAINTLSRFAVATSALHMAVLDVIITFVLARLE